MACQRLPIRLTGPPRFIGVPRRTPTPGHRPRGAPRLARPAAAAVRRPALRRTRRDMQRIGSTPRRWPAQRLWPRTQLSVAPITRSKASFWPPPFGTSKWFRSKEMGSGTIFLHLDLLLVSQLTRATLSRLSVEMADRVVLDRGPSRPPFCKRRQPWLGAIRAVFDPGVR